LAIPVNDFPNEVVTVEKGSPGNQSAGFALSEEIATRKPLFPSFRPHARHSFAHTSGLKKFFAN
jgi:hypothetical protein